MKRQSLLVGLLAAVLALCVLVPVTTVGEEGGSAGQASYDKKCAMCHGKDGVAKKMAAGSANLNDPEWQEKTSVEDIVKVSVEGKNKMKGFKDKLTAEEIEAIAKYVKTLK